MARLANGLNVVIECKGIFDDKAEAAERWTREHWIPAVVNSPDLPEGLRHWAYVMVFNAAKLPAELDRLASGEPPSKGLRPSERTSHSAGLSPHGN